MDKIAVLIPCYNESLTIGKVIKDWHKSLPEAIIYVYNNNSTDDTVQIALDAGAIVRSETQQGKGNVIRRMFREINAQCYIMVDGDDTYPAESGPEMVDLVLNSKIDMVIGDRLSSTYFTENKRPFHNMGNTVVRHMINRVFRCDVKDIMTGLRAFSYEFVKTFPTLSEGFEIETEMTIHAIDKRMTIQNVVIPYRNRPDGSESKLNTISDGLKVIFTVFNLFKNYKPYAFFSVISLLLLGVAVLFFIPVFNEYLHTGLVERFPTLIVCGFTVIASLLSFFTGLILDSLMLKSKQDFEFRRQLIHNQFHEKNN